MSGRLWILILAAVIVAAGTTRYVLNWLEQQQQAAVEQQKQSEPEPQKTAVSKKRVLVVKEGVSPGAIFQTDDVKWEQWPTSLIQDDYLVANSDGQDDAVDAVAGAVARQSIANGTPIVPSMYIKPGDQGFLAAVVDRGMRAVSIPVDSTAILAGLVFPGDRVDVILTHTISSEARAAGENGREVRASETILRDVRVLAMDQRTSNPENKPQMAQTVSLEVTAKQAEKLLLAQDIGQLRLSLRSVARGDGGPDAPSRADPTLGGNVSRVIRLPGAAKQVEEQPNDDPPNGQVTVDVTRGAKTEERSFTGDAGG